MTSTAVIRQRAIESEATTWLYGNTDGAAQRFDRTAQWARDHLDTPGRRAHCAGAWSANDGLKSAAICVVQIELGEKPGFVS